MEKFLRKINSSAHPWLAIAILAAPMSVFAQTMDDQTMGKFTMVGSFTSSYTQVKQGDITFTGGSLAGSSTITTTSGQGSLFSEGQDFLMSCVVFSENSKDSTSLKAPCTFTENDDQFFGTFLREEGDLGSANTGGMGILQIDGGTGKYANFTSSCSYEVNYLSEGVGDLTAECGHESHDHTQKSSAVDAQPEQFLQQQHQQIMIPR